MTPVNVIYHQAGDGWWADSPGIPGWTATADTIDELRSIAEAGVRFALEDDDAWIEHHLEGGRLAAITFDFVLGQPTVGVPAAGYEVTA